MLSFRAEPGRARGQDPAGLSREGDSQLREGPGGWANSAAPKISKERLSAQKQRTLSPADCKAPGSLRGHCPGPQSQMLSQRAQGNLSLDPHTTDDILGQAPGGNQARSCSGPGVLGRLAAAAIISPSFPSLGPVTSGCRRGHPLHLTPSDIPKRQADDTRGLPAAERLQGCT